MTIEWMSSILAFLAGLITGATIMSKVIGERMKDLEEQREIYITEIIELKNKLKAPNDE